MSLPTFFLRWYFVGSDILSKAIFWCRQYFFNADILASAIFCWKWYFVVPFLTTESLLDTKPWVGMDIGSGIQEKLVGTWKNRRTFFIMSTLASCWCLVYVVSGCAVLQSLMFWFFNWSLLFVLTYINTASVSYWWLIRYFSVDIW